MVDGSEKAESVIASDLQHQWDRALIVISMPHAAAFGAFYGRFDFSDPAKDPGSAFILMSLVVLVLPMTTYWLFLVYDLLRNVFLRDGHHGLWLKIKHNVIYLICCIYPIFALVLFSLAQKRDNKVALMLLFMTMFSWQFCAIMTSNHIYLKAMKALGVKLDD